MPLAVNLLSNLHITKLNIVCLRSVSHSRNGPLALFRPDSSVPALRNCGVCSPALEQALPQNETRGASPQREMQILCSSPTSHRCGHIHGVCRGTGGTAKAARSRSSNGAQQMLKGCTCCDIVLLGGRLEGRGGQKVFRKPYPWPKKFTFDQHTHLKTHEFTSCFGEVQTSIYHGFWHSRVMLLGEDIKHHHKAGSCNGSKPPAAAAWCCVGTVLGWYWASGTRSGACWDRQREKLSKQPETEQRREQRALISGCKHKGWKGPKEERNKE